MMDRHVRGSLLPFSSKEEIDIALLEQMAEGEGSDLPNLILEISEMSSPVRTFKKKKPRIS
jgi:hypothetical protein